MSDFTTNMTVEDKVKLARRAVSNRPDVKFPIGNFNIIGGKLYAYSGKIGVNSTPTNLFDVKTDNYTLVCKLSLANNTNANDDFNYKVYLNDVIVNEWVYFRALTIDMAQPYPYEFVIPPFTKVRIVAQNWSNNNTREQSATIVGDVMEGNL